MKAARWYEKGDIRVEDIPIPEPGPGEVRIKVKVCGICGSDLHEYNAGPFIIPRRPHPLTGRELGPVTLGHEFSGDLDALGEGVSGWEKGEKVTVNPLIYCGECVGCKSGQHLLCSKLATAGFAADGAFAEYIVVPAYGLTRLADNIDYDMGAFVEPLAVAVRAVRRSGLQMGQTVAIIGGGPIGLLVALVCKALGASKIFISEPMQSRLELAAKLGVTAAIDPTKDDPGKVIAGYTNKARADVAIDCVGIQQSFDAAIKVTGRRATICVAGLALKPIEVPFLKLWGHEKTVTFTQGYEDADFATAAALLENGSVDIKPLITGRIGLDKLVDDGLKALKEHADKQVKILVYPEK
jgi:(R,R)-butanediol dehydrogenase/meso-butanediol dehydrogenase/diacetyl reductase